MRAANDIARIIDLVTSEGWLSEVFFLPFSLSHFLFPVALFRGVTPLGLFPSDRVFFLGPTVNRIFHRHNPVQSSQQPPQSWNPRQNPPPNPQHQKFVL